MIKRSYNKSAELLTRSEKVLAGGVSSEFRKRGYPHAMFYTHGKGSRIYDVDGNEYLDYTLSQGPLILGHANPEVLEKVAEYSSKGQVFAGQHLKEIELAEKLNEIIPSAELMRFSLDGTSAIQTAFRVARGKTGRQKFLRFEGHYHGWADNVSWGLSTPSVDALGSREEPEVYPWSDGLPENTKDHFIIIPWNDKEILEQTVKRHYREIAGIITEPVMCDNGCILPQKGYLELMRQLCDQYKMALIFDEVITGFRLGLGGAQKFFGITPDISIFAKAMASGYPISAVVGKRDWMRVIEESKVIHAGTMNSNCSTVAAALATIHVLERENPYKRLFEYGERLRKGMEKVAKETHQNLVVQGVGPIMNTAFSSLHEIKDYRDVLTFDLPKLRKFIAGLHDRGVRVIGRGLWYISTAHTEEDIEKAVEVAGDVLKEIGSGR